MIQLKKTKKRPQSLLKSVVLDQPTVDSGGVSRARSVAVAVGCCLFALQWQFNGTSMALQQNFNGTSMAFQQHFNGTSSADKKCNFPCSAKKSL